MNNQNIQYNVFFFLFLDIFTLETSDSIFRVFSYKTELKLFHSFFKTLHIKSKETLLRSSFFFVFFPSLPRISFSFSSKLSSSLKKSVSVNDIGSVSWKLQSHCPSSVCVSFLSRCRDVGETVCGGGGGGFFYFVTESPKVTKKIHKQFIFLRVDGWSQVCARPPANAIARVCEIYSICRSNCRCHVVPWATLWGHTK